MDPNLVKIKQSYLDKVKRGEEKLAMAYVRAMNDATDYLRRILQDNDQQITRERHEFDVQLKKELADGLKR